MSTTHRRSATDSVAVSVAALVAGLLLALVPTVTATARPAPVGGPAATAAAEVTPAVKYRRQAQRATNAARKRHDLRKFRTDKCLRKWARKHAKRLAAEDEGLWHQNLKRVKKNCGLDWAGENVAVGYPTGKAVVNQGWMQSEGHRRNILHTQYRLSVVEARRSDAGWWYAVQLFGRR